MIDTPYLKPAQYGTILFEGAQIACVFAGDPGKFTAYIDVEGVCDLVGLPFNGEIDRIQNNHLIHDGLFVSTFWYLDENRKRVDIDRPVISLTRLHTWLALIPPDTVSDEILRQKLSITQKELTDVIYGYFGRTLMPREMQEEDDTYLDPGKKEMYDKLKDAAVAAERIGIMENRLERLEEQVRGLSISISAENDNECIDVDHQAQFRAILGILAKQYAKKYGAGLYYKVEANLKARFHYHFYREITKEQWPALIRECEQIYKSLFPKGSAIPRQLAEAINEIQQDSLF